MGRIKIFTSGRNQSGSSSADSAPLRDMVARAAFSITSMANNENTWLTIDFGDNILIKPTQYRLQHYDSDKNYMRNWNLLGSTDGVNWEIIKKHGTNWLEGSPPFTKPYQSIIFEIENARNYYKIFKIKMISPNTGAKGENESGTWEICVHSFEVYGFVRGNIN